LIHVKVVEKELQDKLKKVN